MDQSYDDSPFRKAPAEYTYTETFVERSNTSGNYGDNTQDFFLTVSQNDWSGGEGQSFFRQADATSRTTYYNGNQVDLSIEGQISFVSNVAQSGSVTGPAVGAHAWSTLVPISLSNTTNTFTYNVSNTRTDRGAHGLGVAPTCQCSSPGAVYLSSEAGGTVGIRRLDATAWTYSTFSATGCSALAYASNVLYGVRSAASFDFVQFSTTGVVSSIFTWKDGNGTAMLPGSLVRLVPFGAKVYIVFSGEVWLYDGVSTSKVWEFGPNFAAQDAWLIQGILVVGGALTGNSRPAAVLWYNNGSYGTLWQFLGLAASLIHIAPWQNGFVFSDTNTSVRYYDLSTGAHSGILGPLTDGMYTGLYSSSGNFLGFQAGDPAISLFPSTSYAWTNAPSIYTSLFDFDNSLTKLFRGIKVDFTNPGGSWVITASYQTDSLTGSYTSAGVLTSGTELALSGVSGRSIGIQLTVTGSGTAPPIIKRIYVRAGPTLQSYRNNVYILDCSGNKAAPQPGYLKLGNDFTHDKDGLEMVADLRTAIATGIVSITDRFGTFNGIIEPAATQFKEVKSGYGRAEYRVELAVREV